MQVIDEEKGRTEAETVLDNIQHSQREFRTYNDFCKRIDAVYSDRADLERAVSIEGFVDQQYDLFWSSIEVLKPAIYAKPPAVVVKPRYSDANATDKMTAEMLERVINSEFERGHINEAMLMVRDDMALLNRGVLWVTHEDEDGNAVCTEWLDREDFVHDPARCWNDVKWVARRAYLTLEEMKKRFKDISGDLWQRAFFGDHRENTGYARAYDDCIPETAAIWEVWDKREKRVRWVTEGIDEYLDDAEPHLNLKDFFPCPRPAYGTLIRRTLVPMPDYRRYVIHLNQINALTKRIYDLLDNVRVMAFAAGSGDIGNAIQNAFRQSSDVSMIVHALPGVALTATGGIDGALSWLPIDVIANTITGLIEARAQLFADFDRLSGISDIMRGETEAEETLGAQRLKSQYGSVRVRDKKDELIRLSRDAARISGEIICENFTQKELLEISQMDIPTRREVDKSIKDLEQAARQEMEALTEGMAETPPEDPEQLAQMQQQLQEAQQQIQEKYAPQFQQLEQAVVIEDVMKLVRDQRGRSLIIDIETDSTVMTDELAEKSARSEFLTAFSGAISAIQPLMAAGEKGAKLAGSMMKFALQPFNVSRDLDATIDEFVEAAPEIAAAMGEQEPDDGGLGAAQMKLAEAEMAKVQSQTEANNANAALKAQELQLKGAEAEQKANQAQQQFALEIEKTRGAIDETMARIEKIYAEIQKLGVDSDNQTRQQDRDDVKAVADIQSRRVDQAMSAEGRQLQAIESERNAQFAERGEERADRQQDFTEQNTERQLTLAEQQAEEARNAGA